MDADAFVQLLNEILFTLLFVATVWQALRHPSRASVQTALLFSSVFALFIIGPVVTLLGLQGSVIPEVVSIAVLVSIPYFLARLTATFSDPPAWVPWLAGTVALALVVATIVTGREFPQWLLLAGVTWFAAAGAYTGLVFLREALRSIGLTRRRMQAVAVGSTLLMAAIVMLISGAILAPGADPPIVLGRLLALGAGVSFWIGCAPPLALRRWWQEPEVRAFLEQAAAVSSIGSERDALSVLEDGAADVLGAPNAVIGLFDQAANKLTYIASDGTDFVTGTDEFVGGRVFTSQQPIFVDDAAGNDPTNAATYRRTGARAVLAAPITAGNRRLGVLCIYSARAPIFADDDLRLVKLLADHAAIVLESRRFSEEAASVRALEATTRLKDDFLSAAAHDLKTPLTVLLGQAELLERFAVKAPQAPTDIDRVRRISNEARRLQHLVEELLDAARIEEGQLVRDLEASDLVELAREACARYQAEGRDLVVQADQPIAGRFDRTRIIQMLDNLIGNARKYSADNSPITIRVWREDESARIAVADSGIGIPAEDLPRLFERFYRASNVGERRHDGMGLGLFICRGIAEQHGGRIWAEANPDGGTTFHVEIPAADPGVTAGTAGGAGSGSLDATAAGDRLTESAASTP